MNIGDKVFFPSLVQDFETKTARLVIYDAEILNIVDESSVEILVNIDGNVQKTISETRMIAETKVEAENRLINYVRRRNINDFEDKRAASPSYLPESISFTEGVFSGNPLRFGEPGVIFGAQSNTFGSAENAQKILQLAGSVIEDYAGPHRQYQFERFSS